MNKLNRQRKQQENAGEWEQMLPARHQSMSHWYSIEQHQTGDHKEDDNALLSTQAKSTEQRHDCLNLHGQPMQMPPLIVTFNKSGGLYYWCATPTNPHRHVTYQSVCRTTLSRLYHSLWCLYHFLVGSIMASVLWQQLLVKWDGHELAASSQDCWILLPMPLHNIINLA